MSPAPLDPEVAVEAVDGSFITADGLKLSTYRLHVPAKDLAPVILMHGLSDHSRSLPYLALGHSLAAQGFEVFACDRRGSGQSAGPANYAASWEILREDLARFVDIVEDQCGRLPALVGLSLGGLQALDFALHAPESVHSCVVMAPALDVSGASALIRKILPVLANWMPKLPVDPGLDDAALVRDPALGRRYRNDPLWRARTTPALAQAAIEVVERVHRDAGRLETPLLIFHGTGDRVVPIAGTRSFFSRVASKDKAFHELPGAFHALPIEPEGQQMALDIGSWLRARCPSIPSAQAV